MSEGQDNLDRSASRDERGDNLLKDHKQSLEITGLGIIVSLMMAAWPLVSDGTLSIPDYLALVAFLLAGAAVLALRLVELAPYRGAGLRSGSLVTRSEESPIPKPHHRRSLD